MLYNVIWVKTAMFSQCINEYMMYVNIVILGNKV